MRWNSTVWVYLPIPRRRTLRQPTMPDQIPEEVKEERRDEIMELQQEISFEKAEEIWLENPCGV